MKVDSQKARVLILSGNAPDNLQVKGSLDLRGRTSLQTLPDNLQVKGSLDLEGCTSLQTLPDNLQVKGSLDLRGCTSLQTLPDNLQVSEWLDLEGSDLPAPNNLQCENVFWGDVRVTRQIAFHPETLTAEDILNEENIEVRRVMIERIGYERFVELMQPEVLHSDMDSGGKRELLKIEMADEEDVVLVNYRCPSTARSYFTRVPPHMQTCHQAVAWIAGFNDPDEYVIVMES